MMKTSFVFLFTFLTSFCYSQTLINLVLVGDKGITKSIKEAKYIIAIKSYGDSVFERLEYKKGGPMMKRISYKDSNLAIKDGPYAEYAENGIISMDGQYGNGKKNGKWHMYNGSVKPIFEYRYEDDILLTKVDMDSLRNTTKDDKLKPGEVEAKYEGGEAGFGQQIKLRMMKSADEEKFKRSGYVEIRFTVNKYGQMVNFNLFRSTEFIFDEECLAVMRTIPNKWTPASKDGKLLNAYRMVPITFTLQ